MVGETKETSVGLIVLTGIPEMGVVAVLQRRGEFDHEKMKRESYPGACQVTCYGKMKEKDWGDPISALQREADEELGSGVFSLFFRDHLEELVRVETEKKSVITFGVLCMDGEELLSTIRLNASSGGLSFLKREDVGRIEDLTTYNKEEGVIDRRVIAMFPGETKAVQLAFEKLKPRF